MPGTSNYQDYRDLPSQPGARHVSDSNVNKYNNFYKGPLRGQSTSSDIGYQQTNNQYQSGYQQVVPGRGQTPLFDRPPIQHRGPTPSYEQEQRNMNYRNNNGNYQLFPRGGTPTNMNTGTQWNYAEDPEMRHGNTNITGSNFSRDHMTPRQDLPPSGGNYGNQSSAYRDPVYTAMAGKRPVKSLHQPNSAKV